MSNCQCWNGSAIGLSVIYMSNSSLKCQHRYFILLFFFPIYLDNNKPVSKTPINKVFLSSSIETAAFIVNQVCCLDNVTFVL